MFNTLGRSWNLTKTTFNVLRKDKEILLYPFLSILLSILFMFLVLIPFFISSISMAAIADNSFSFTTGMYLIFFLIYLGMFFIITFFDVLISYTAKTRFEGENATVGSSFKFGFKKIHIIFLWSIMRATVNVLINFIDSAARNGKGPIKLLGIILSSILSLAWRIVTLFVIPSLVYKGLTPFKSIKDSIDVLKKTWGESLIVYIGMGSVNGILTLILLLLFIVPAAISFFSGAMSVTIILGSIFIFFMFIKFLIFSAADTIFDTALYYYAQTGAVPQGYEKENMANAFKPKGDKNSSLSKPPVNTTINNDNIESSGENNLSVEEQNAKGYIESYKTSYSKESIKTALINSGISQENTIKYLEKYF